MVALAANRDGTYYQYVDTMDGNVVSMDVEAGEIIYQGALVMMVPGNGGIQPLADTAGGIFMGINIGGLVNNSTGADGALEADIFVGRFIAQLAKGGSAFTIADLGTLVAGVDDQTVDILGTTTNDVTVGRFIRLDGTAHWFLCAANIN